MKRYLVPVAAFAAALCAMPVHALEEEQPPRWSLALHGGAGTILPENITDEQRAEYEAALAGALEAGAQILRDGGSAMDAVRAVIVPLEDDPKFNAGRGAVYTWDGTNELDASIMDGRDRSAGAVAGVTTVKNPILLASEVLADGRHVFLSGAGAETFAAQRGIEITLPSWFGTQRRKDALERMKADQLSAADVDHKFGTVGAVALDGQGNLAAGTSTGGLTGKRWGRIGDVPVLGAGTYADNRSCAVSATGQGEYFIRVGVAQEICTRLRFRSRSAGGAKLALGDVQQVADDVMAEVKELGGTGGVIVVNPGGHAIFSFNTPGMYRARMTSEGTREVAIFSEE